MNTASLYGVRPSLEFVQTAALVENARACAAGRLTTASYLKSWA